MALYYSTIFKGQLFSQGSRYLLLVWAVKVCSVNQNKLQSPFVHGKIIYPTPPPECVTKTSTPSSWSSEFIYPNSIVFHESSLLWHLLKMFAREAWTKNSFSPSGYKKNHPTLLDRKICQFPTFSPDPTSPPVLNGYPLIMDWLLS